MALVIVWVGAWGRAWGGTWGRACGGSGTWGRTWGGGKLELEADEIWGCGIDMLKSNSLLIIKVKIDIYVVIKRYDHAKSNNLFNGYSKYRKWYVRKNILPFRQQWNKML